MGSLSGGRACLRLALLGVLATALVAGAVAMWTEAARGAPDRSAGAGRSAGDVVGRAHGE